MLRRKAIAASAAAVGCLALTATASAATRTVTAGPPTKASADVLEKASTTVNAYFPSRTVIHVGDSVRFVPNGFHNMDIPAKGSNAGTPLFLPNGTKIEGAVDAAGTPFWFNGLDNLSFNPALLAPAFGKTVSFDGTTRVQSGLPLAPNPKPMVVRFTKAGTYTILCDVHPGMKATVVVRSRRAKVPTAKAHTKRAAHQVADALAAAKNLSKATPPANTVDVGEAGPGGVEYLGMLPGNLDVPVGTTVRFRITKGSFEPHTATFGPGDPMNDPGSYLGKIAASFEGAPVLDPAGVYPSDAPGTASTLDPTTHGNGFWNSGVIDLTPATPQIPDSASVQFTTAGTYTYYCLIHPFMKGTVTVR